MKKNTVFLTGATGTMGFQGLIQLSQRLDRYNLRLLVRDNKTNRKKLAPFLKMNGIDVIWGDLMNFDDVCRGIRGVDIVLHVGGMVSPKADYFPDATIKVNVGACENIVRALYKTNQLETTRVVYIGSISQYGSRPAGKHWGRTGDPMWNAEGDMYAYSKIMGERVIAEAGIKRWVSLRQTGILSPLLINKGSDPITFHVPINGALEWTTDETSGILLANICDPRLPDDFWNKFYNLGNGHSFRLSNYAFEQLILKSMNCPPPEKIFETNWFALRNFHGIWYEDSDILENYLHFRTEESANEYFDRFAKGLPWFFSLTRIVPSFLIKMGMRMVAEKKPFGTLYAIKHNDETLINRMFKSREKWAKIPDWNDFQILNLTDKPTRLNHGYDETKPDYMLDIEDMHRAARFRGGRCLSDTMTTGNLSTPLEWECHQGHRFSASPLLILKGGHWCNKCFNKNANYRELAMHNPFFAQSWE